MVKVKAICRVPEECTRETRKDINKQFKNPDSTLHPLQKAREYKRALNSAKLEKIFAKPFVHSLSEHTDSVYSLSRSDKYLSLVVSGSCNGEVKLWDLTSFTCKKSFEDSHRGFVTGVSFRKDHFISSGQDCVVKLYGLDGAVQSYNSSMGLQGCDFSWSEEAFVSCGNDGVELWDVNRSHPIGTFEWGHDTTTKAKYNPAESHLVGSVCLDRSIILIDTRANSCLNKITTKLKSNDLAWNPREPMNFTVANEDGNLYTFDMRYTEEPKKIHKDHLNAVTSVAYSATGREFVSGSFDKTIRIFDIREGRSREVYHGRRMQWVYSVEFTGDGKFVLSGSDDTNIRVWKARAHLPLKTLLPREEEAINYREKLKNQYKHVPQVRKILRHRHLPKLLYRLRKKKQVMKESEYRKEQNRRANTKAENIKDVSLKKQVVINQG